MPLIDTNYQAPWWLPGGHAQTIATCFRRIPNQPKHDQVEVELPDGDIVDVDVYAQGSSHVAIVTHGLEGSSKAACVRGVSKQLFAAGWDVWAWNFRTCSGRHNRNPVLYHSACTPDLHAVITAALDRGHETAALVGYSLGGNLTLKYLGEKRSDVHPHLKAAIAVSAPVDLPDAVDHLDRGIQWLYREVFLRSLRKRALWRRDHLPADLPFEDIWQLKTFREFDNAFTAPLHGFTNADDYYQRASSLPVLEHISIPTLLLSALDDPILPGSCFPFELAKRHEFLHLEAPRRGGHCAFFSCDELGHCWSEERVKEFLHQHAGLPKTRANKQAQVPG